MELMLENPLALAFAAIIGIIVALGLGYFLGSKVTIGNHTVFRLVRASCTINLLAMIAFVALPRFELDTRVTVFLIMMLVYGFTGGAVERSAVLHRS